MGSLSIWHWMVVIVVVLLLFGRGKISELMGDMAQGIKAFKKGMADDDKTAATPEAPKSIDHQATAEAAKPNADIRQHAQTERKFEGTAS
jgi:sec-independent protein translocase protein TatA